MMPNATINPSTDHGTAAPHSTLTVEAAIAISVSALVALGIVVAIAIFVVRRFKRIRASTSRPATGTSSEVYGGLKRITVRATVDSIQPDAVSRLKPSTSLISSTELEVLELLGEGSLGPLNRGTG
jgi:hypothetical protein